MARGFAASKLALGFLVLILALSYHTADSQSFSTASTTPNTASTTPNTASTTPNTASTTPNTASTTPKNTTDTNSSTTSITSTTSTTSTSQTTTATTAASVPPYGIALVVMAAISCAVGLCLTGIMIYFIMFA
uniref:Cell wall protein DAN4-like n=1 Tax=Geotrypetes seraphini TaxID=260995 RepID=A0A6P8NQ25_GEOSA|nr:cell wall protein DAN4-like [Geotrypetes seraphini]